LKFYSFLLDETKSKKSLVFRGIHATFGDKEQGLTSQILERAVLNSTIKAKAVPLLATKALGGEEV
jgi:hypothetical protein